MLRRISYVLAVVVAVYTLSACGQKKQAAGEGSGGKGASGTAKQAVVPGEMVLIPAGEFIFGTNDKESASYPEQKISLPAFWIDKYEVTFKQFLDFSIKTGYAGEGAKEDKDWRLFFTPEKALFPVVYVTWKDADEYCKSLGKRLPTEEEWEKAARGTDGRRFPWGNDWDPNRSNVYESGGGKMAAVGLYNDVSPYGVHDMFGNVQEWTATWYSTYKGNPKKDPSHSGQKFRVVRGLSARFMAKSAHIYDRSAWNPSALYDFGFRCAKDATPEEAAKATQAK